IIYFCIILIGMLFLFACGLISVCWYMGLKQQKIKNENREFMNQLLQDRGESILYPKHLPNNELLMQANNFNNQKIINGEQGGLLIENDIEEQPIEKSNKQKRKRLSTKGKYDKNNNNDNNNQI